MIWLVVVLAALMLLGSFTMKVYMTELSNEIRDLKIIGIVENIQIAMMWIGLVLFMITVNMTGTWI